MADWNAGSVEAKFADLIWASAPLPSGQLAKLAEEAFGWKKTTSFTVLKRLCNRCIFQNEKGIVSPPISRDAFNARHSEQCVDEAFGGSLPAFVAAFCSRKRLKDSEIAELEQVIAEMRRQNDAL